MDYIVLNKESLPENIDDHIKNNFPGQINNREMLMKEYQGI